MKCTYSMYIIIIYICSIILCKLHADARTEVILELASYWICKLSQCVFIYSCIAVYKTYTHSTYEFRWNTSATFLSRFQFLETYRLLQSSNLQQCRKKFIICMSFNLQRLVLLTRKGSTDLCLLTLYCICYQLVTYAYVTNTSEIPFSKELTDNYCALRFQLRV